MRQTHLELVSERTLMTDVLRVEVVHFKAAVVDLLLRQLHEKEGVVVAVVLAEVDTHKGADVAAVVVDHDVGRLEVKVLGEPGIGCFEVGAAKTIVTELVYGGGLDLKSLELANSRFLLLKILRLVSIAPTVIDGGRAPP